MKLIISGMLFISLCAATLSAGSKDKSTGKKDKSERPYAIGEKVKVEVASKSHDAEVIGYDSVTGWVKVKYKYNGLELKTAQPLNKVQMAVKEKDADQIAGDEKPAADGDNPFATKKKKSGKTKSKSDESSKSTDKRASSLSKDKARVWTERTGKFKISGKFVKLDGDQIILERSDNKNPVTMPLASLSNNDQKIAQEFSDQTPQESESQSAFPPTSTRRGD